MADLLKIGSLWRGEDKNGNEMFSGNVDIPVGVIVDDTKRIVVLFNDRKEADNHPDFQIFVTKNEPRNG
jgi:uncharacterized protein (DUF736 family)